MIIKRNFKQRLKSVQGLRSFKNTLPTTIKKIIIKKGKIYSKILENWKFIIGDELFSHCHPRSIKISNKVTDSCLSIMVLRGKEVDIEYSRNEILKKVNSLIGYEVVKKIKLVSFESNINENIKNINENIKKKRDYVTNNKFTKKISSVKNEKIRKSLKNLNNAYKVR
tara:strand:+ start:329 stop:832 length:504 start_codon:yes stop_codon:yes gene_type:complete